MKKYDYFKAMGIALGLPGIMLGTTLFTNHLVEEKIISQTVGYLILGFIVINVFYLMVRSGRK